MMKNFTRRFTLFLIVFACSTSFVKAQIGAGYWSFSNPKPFGFYVTSTSFIDDNTGLMVGGAGGIAKTLDGGATWNYIAFTFSGPSGDIIKPILDEVQFITPTTAMAVGTNGVMAKSTDAGITWNFISTPFFASGTEIYTLYFFDENHGYIAGEPVDGNTSLYYTANGGSSWTRATGLPEENRAILKIRFSPNGVGYATGMHNGVWEADGASSLVWKYDQGVWYDYSIKKATLFPNVHANDTAIFPHSWDDGIDTVPSTYDDNVSGLSMASYRGLAIMDDTTIVIGAQNNGMIVRLNTSTPEGSYLMINNGSAYTDYYRPLGSPSIYNMLYKNGAVAAPGGNGALIKSTDKGYTFTSSLVYTEEPEANTDFNAIDITAGNRYVLGGSGGIIADSLGSWRKPYQVVKKGGFFSSAGLSDIKFLDANNGIAAGAAGTLMRTSDGGTTWEDKTTPGFQDWDSYTSIAYLSPTVLYASVSNGQFYRSSDKGNTFDLLFMEPSGGRLASMDFVSQDTGYMIANTMIDIPDDPATEDYDEYYVYHNVAYKTTDGGFTWDSSANAFPSGAYETISSPSNIKFLNKNIGYIVGTNGTIYKTTDAATTWSLLSNVPSDIATITLESIAVVNEDVAYAVGWSGTVIKTTDGGATWVHADNGLPTLYNNFYKVLMYDANQGIIFASGNIYTTKDGGSSWTPYYAPVSEFMFAACFAPMDNCTEGICKKVYVGTGMSGYILKFDVDRVLPVKFSKLTGTAVTTGNQLFWTAFSQYAVKYFEVEGSSNGTSFEKISDKIYPSGTNAQSYNWLDENAPAGKRFYRVKVYEENGAVYYTNIITIGTQKASGWVQQLNNSNLIITNANTAKGDVTVQVVNTAGQVVTARTRYQNGGAYNDAIQLPATAKGIYLVKIVNAGTVNSFKIFIQ